LTGGTAGNDITVTLANGETITIEAGQTSGSTTTATRVDEEYIQGTATITNSIANVVETSSDAAPKLESVAAAADTSVSTSVTDDRMLLRQAVMQRRSLRVWRLRPIQVLARQ